MSDETSTIRILDADPERVVSVTVGELQEIVRSHPKTAHQFHTLAIHERTCHPKGDWKPVSQTQKVRRLVCDCGYEFGVDRENASPFDISIMCELPNFCPNCGARITRGGDS